MPNALYVSCLFVAILSLAPARDAFPDDGPHLLDGQAFSGFNGEKGLPLDPGEKEEIIFENGRFRSVSCDPYNFDDGDYTATAVGDSIHFEAVTKSPTHGTITWKGIVQGDTAKMTFLWTKERWYWDTRREYWFQGARKK
ncbi:MAG: hypothetical protein KJN79_03835 [Gammaproteobacteria bacterium]|nr:hypothetical protein [Gammaproteobacteria bacterium]